jgi:hypothetical protein
VDPAGRQDRQSRSIEQEGKTHPEKIGMGFTFCALHQEKVESGGNSYLFESVLCCIPVFD